jgi:hypothetical protein
MGLLKSFKKILKSPLGKAALGIGAFMYGPKFLGGSEMAKGLQGWQGLQWGKIPAWKIATSVMGAGAVLGDEEEDDDKPKIDTSGHEGYLNSRKMYIDEWTQWLMDQDDTLTYEEAHAQASDPLFNKAQGGLIGLAQGGRIKGNRYGFEEGDAIGWSDADHGPTGWSGDPGVDAEESQPISNQDYQGALISGRHGQVHRGDPTKTVLPSRTLTNLPGGKTRTRLAPSKGNWFTNALDTGANYMYNKVPTFSWTHGKRQRFFGGLTEAQKASLGYNFNTNWEDLTEDQKNQLMSSDVYSDLNRYGYQDWLKKDYGDKFGSTGGDGPQEDWQRLGYSSYAAWLAAQGGGGGGGAGTGGVGDYYGYKEWEDWEGGPTTPLFGDATSYQGLLSKGGRIGLYAGGMGGMSNPMNPMMNQGLGGVGPRGMNPYNQQNLMQQAGGMPQGRPTMPGGPTTAQGPGITSARLPKQTEDNELLELIRMLASMGIPMEQLRGRTKEELVEMVMSLSSKAQAQGGGEEVVEESEEVVEAAHGGRIRAAYGYPNPDKEFISETQLEENYPGLARGELGEVIEEDEEEEIYIPRAQGGLMRTRYAMGTPQPIIPSRDGPQLDYRGIGGYQTQGAKEKKDDVRALLAQGEFVVTSDAVKGIGGGDRDLGAKRMYDMMHKYEPIGRALS